MMAALQQEIALYFTAENQKRLDEFLIAYVTEPDRGIACLELYIIVIDCMQKQLREQLPPKIVGLQTEVTRRDTLLIDETPIREGTDTKA